MKIKCINDISLPPLVLIHGGNSTLEEWEKYVEYFKDKYSLYLVSISAHGEDFDNEYTSIHTNAEDIITYFKENNITSIYVYGRGLGAQIALAIIEQAPSLVSKVILESISCISLGFYKLPMRLGMTKSYQEDEEAIKLKKRLPKYKFKKMIYDNTSFVLDIRINEFKNKALVMYSENDDKFFQKSAELLSRNIQDIQIKKYNYGHLFGLTHFNDIILDIEQFLVS